MIRTGRIFGDNGRENGFLLRRRCEKALTVMLTLATLAAGHTQSGRVRPQPDGSQSNKDSIRLRVEEVLLPLSVRSDTGKLPTYLDRSDFIVTEDGRRQEITSVQRTPANVLLVLDTSGEATTLKEINLHRDLAMRLIEGLGPEDRAAIITYAEKVNVLSSWTGDRSTLQVALKERFKPGLKSALYDSLLYAAEEMLRNATGRRSVVLVTDGIDSFHWQGFEKALAALHRARATVYVIAQNRCLIEELKPVVFNKLAWLQMMDPQTRKRFERLRTYSRRLEAAEVTLEKLAQDTGGAIWNPARREELEALDKLSRQLIEEIGTEYLLAYSSQRKTGDESFHPIKVYATRRDLKVRARRGVYSTFATDPARAGIGRKEEGKRQKDKEETR